jgi:membrane associated rhomboid family serine protease
LDITAAQRSEGEKIYTAGARPLWRLRGAIGFFGICGLTAVPGFARWALGGAAPSPSIWFLALASGAFMLIGLFMLARARLGLPKLHVTPTGIVLEGMFATRWADYDSIAMLALTTSHARRDSRSIDWAVADVVGESAHPIWRRRATFHIPDDFDTPIVDIIRDINTRRARVVGVRAAPVAMSMRADDALVGVAGFRFAWLTVALFALLVAVFVLEHALAVDHAVVDPTDPELLLQVGPRTLLALGALNWGLVHDDGQWFRLLTAPLLHLNLRHLVANGIGLLIAGVLLERLVGRAWLLALFVVGAVGGSLMSLAADPANWISVGASGAIMGLMAGLFVASFHLQSGSVLRLQTQIQALYVLIPILVQLSATMVAGHFDVAAHLGGVLSGGAAALVLLRVWRAGERLPRHRKIAGAIAAVGALGLLLGGVVLGSHDPMRTD